MTETSTSTPTPTPQPLPEPKPSFGERLASAFIGFVRFLVRLLIILITLGLIAGAVYLALPYVYKRYVQPLQDVQTQVAALQQESATRAEQVNQRLVALQDDLTALRSQQDDLMAQIEKQQSSYEALQARIDALESHQQAIADQLDALKAELGTADDKVAAAQATADALQAEWEALQPQLQAADQQMTVLRALNSLTRARLLIGQANYGLAKDELATTAAILGWLQTEGGMADSDTLANALQQVQLAQQALPEAPAAALQNLEAAWQLLNSLLPAVTPAPSPTASPAPTATPTPTPKP